MSTTAPLSAEPPVPDGVLARADASDVAELTVLQRCCWVSEAIRNDTLDIPALHETLDEVAAWVGRCAVWTVRVGGRLVAAVRAHREGDRWEIGRLMVAPDQQGRGLGRWLLEHAEAQAPPTVRHLVLFTGSRSTRNLRMYTAAGYVRTDPPAAADLPHIANAVFLTKPRDVTPSARPSL